MRTIKRIAPSSTKSYFLFGPRATGKSTWLKNEAHPDFSIDLLKSKDFIRFSANPDLLRQIIEGNSTFKVIVVDEIQRLPILLNEIHSLIFDYGNKLQFILTGSSARKLKKNNVNLLAGRALVRYFHTLSAQELGRDFDITKTLKYGLLPQIWNLKNRDDIVDYLYSYVETYLKEEVQQEAAVRSLPSYISFLEHFAIRNGQVMNIQSLASDVGLARTTINGYLDVLEQTLLGTRLSPIHLKAKVKEVSLPKFYFFDTGVCRTLAKMVEEDLREDKGTLLETYILHELKAYSDYFLKRWEFFYWGTPSQNEVDFIVCKANKRIGIEVKASTRWSKDFNYGLKTLLAEKKILKAYGVYLGTEVIRTEGIEVLPVQVFVSRLFAGKIHP